MRVLGSLLRGCINFLSPQGIENACDIQTPVHEIILPENAPEQAHNLAIVQITDTHLHDEDHVVNSGLIFDALSKAEKQLNVQNIPTEKRVLVFTGDLVSAQTQFAKASVLSDAEAFCDQLRQHPGFARKWYVLGNHDEMHPQIEDIKALLQQAGFERLRHDSFCGVDFSGTPDYWETAEAFDDVFLDDLIHRVQQNIFTVILSHNPDWVDHQEGHKFLEEIREKAFLVLAGHTHGCQIDIPLLRKFILWNSKFKSELISGFYERGNGQVYVSPGVGVQHQLPHRYGKKAIPEIPTFILKSS